MDSTDRTLGSRGSDNAAGDWTPPGGSGHPPTGGRAVSSRVAGGERGGMFRALAGAALGRPEAVKVVYEQIQRLARRCAERDHHLAEEAAQAVALRILVDAHVVVARLLATAPEVRERCPDAAAVWAHAGDLPGADGRAVRYLQAAARNAVVDLVRARRRRHEEPLDNTTADRSTGGDGDDESLDEVRATLEVVRGALAPADAAGLDEILALSLGERSIQELVAAEAPGGDPADARRARDRIYKRHQRVREQFGKEVEARRAAGRLPEVHAETLIRWAASLRRRIPTGPSVHTDGRSG